MFVLIGLLVVIGCVFGGYILAGGKLEIILAALPLEMMIIGGSGIGAYIIANNAHVLKATLGNLKLALTGPRYRKADYVELLSLLFLLFRTIRSKGPKGIEKDIDNPTDSDLFNQFPRIAKNHHAVEFICDYTRLLVLRVETPHELEALMDQEIKAIAEEMAHGSHALQILADGLPALGIVAAVLGVIKTMTAIGSPPAILGKMIASALVGTFLGVFLSYGLFGPLATKVKAIHESDLKLFVAIKAAFVAHLGGAQPPVAVEFGRKVLAEGTRPGFTEIDEAVQRFVSSGAAPVAKAA